MAKKTLAELITATYEDDDVASHITDEVAKAGTEARILAGELVLPHPSDARRHYLASKGLAGLTEVQQAERSRMIALEQLVAEMADQIEKPNKERAKVIAERVEAIKGGGN